MKIQIASLAFALGASLKGDIIDLTTVGSFGSLNGGLFVQQQAAPTGSGVIQSFVRVNPGGSGVFEQGYNTDGRIAGGLQYDENSSPSFTRSLLLSAVPLVTCVGGNIAGCLDGVSYREFNLDINQTNNDPLLSLNRVVILQRGAGDLIDATLPAGTALGAVQLDGTGLFSALLSNLLVYDSGAGNRVDLNYSLESGSGQGDMRMYIPDLLFSGVGQFVFLYSEFGGSGIEPPYQGNDGYEEWSVRTPTPFDVVPEPTSVALFGTALLVIASKFRAARKRSESGE